MSVPYITYMEWGVGMWWGGGWGGGGGGEISVSMFA